MKKWAFILLAGLFAAACGGDKTNQQAASEPASEPAAAGTNDQSGEKKENPSYDPKRGLGKFTQVEVSPTLDKPMADNGEKVYSVKCAGCHKLTDERLVGPGWMDVTKRNTAEWIMNFSTNTAEMLDKDPKAQAQLEICLVRMPNQNLSDEDARAVYEFMRKNDGVK